MSDGVIGKAEIEIRPNTRNFDKDVQSGISGPLGSAGGPLKTLQGLFDKLGLSGASNLLKIGEKASGVAGGLNKIGAAGDGAFTGIEQGAVGAETALGTVDASAATTSEQLALLGPAGETAAAGLEAPGIAATSSAEQLTLLGVAGDDAAVGLTAAGTAAESSVVPLEAETAAAEGASATLGTLALAGAALVAVGISKWALDSALSFRDSAIEVLKFQRVTGASAEDTSKLRVALELVGISTDTAGRGFFILNKTIGDGTTKLGNYGIQVARNKQGNVDLIETVLRIGDAYKATTDSTTRAAIVQAAFGRGGKELIPILTKSRTEMKALFDEAAKKGEIFSASDVQEAVDFNRAQRDLSATTSQLGRDVGRELLPQLTKVVQTADGVVTIFNGIGEAIGSVTGKIPGLGTGLTSVVDILTGSSLGSAVSTIQEIGSAIGALSDKTDRQSQLQKILDDNTNKYTDLLSQGKGHTDEARKAQEQMGLASKGLADDQQKVATALGGTAKQADDARKALTNLSTTMLGFGDADLQAQQSVIDYQNALANVQTAIDAVTKAKADGKQTDETDAQYLQRLAQLQRNVASAVLGVGTAQENVAKTSLAAITSQKAYEEAIRDPKARLALIDQLNQAKTKYGDTTGAIQAQIDKLNAWDQHKPAEKTLTVKTGAATAAVTGLQGFIDGVHGKTVEIAAEVRVLGQTALLATLAALGKIRIAVNGTPQGAAGIGIPGPVGQPYPMIAHGGELVLNASQVAAIGSGAAMLAPKTTGTLPVTASSRPVGTTGNVGDRIVVQSGAIVQHIGSGVDRAMLAEANARLVADLTDALTVEG